MKKFKLLLLVISALFLLPFSVFAEEDEAEATESKEVNVYLFRGEGCPHCQEAEEWFQMRNWRSQWTYLPSAEAH